MLKYMMTIAASAAFTVLAGAASATTLTFDSDADCTGPAVTITAGAGNGPCASIPGFFLSNSPNGTSALTASSQRGNDFWTATFASLASGVSIDLGDFNADADRLFVNAYDAANALIEAITLDIDPSDATMHTLALASTGIKSITFGITGDLGTGTGIYADNLTFDAATPEVPLPAAGLMLLAAVGGLGAMRRRRK